MVLFPRENVSTGGFPSKHQSRRESQSHRAPGLSVLKALTWKRDNTLSWSLSFIGSLQVCIGEGIFLRSTSGSALRVWTEYVIDFALAALSMVGRRSILNVHPGTSIVRQL